MTTPTHQPDVLLFGLCCIAIFCFYSFPMVIFSWLSQSNIWLTINPCNHLQHFRPPFITLLGWDIYFHLLHVLTSFCLSTLLNMTATSLRRNLLQPDYIHDVLGPILVISCFLFILLDLSAAFDRVNHLLLLKTFSSSALLLYILSHWQRFLLSLSRLAVSLLIDF